LRHGRYDATAIRHSLPTKPWRDALARRGCLLGLIVLGLAWELWLAPIKPGGSLLALKVLPLCIPLAGVLKNRMYTYRWVSLMVWLYFTEGVVRAWSDKAPGAWRSRWSKCCCASAVRRLRAACAAAPEKCQGRRPRPSSGGPSESNHHARPDRQLRQIVGAAQRTDPRRPRRDLAAYEQDWRKRARGKALAVVRPGSTMQVADVVKACAAAGTTARAAGRQHRPGGRLDSRRQRHAGGAEPAAHEPVRNIDPGQPRP
jgi:uncharacterized membrane protein